MRARRVRSFGVVALLLAGALPFASPLPAQQYGRWWWDGRVGYRDRTDRQELDGLRLRDYAEGELGLSLGINGYLGHPTIGRFRVGVDYRALDFRQSGIDSSERLGYSLDLNVLPHGVVSGRLRIAEETIDYTYPEGADAFLLLRQPESSSVRRGSLRIRRGPLVGTQLGYEQSSYRLGSGGDLVDRLENAFLDWARPIGTLQNHFRVRHERRDYSSVAYDSDSWLAGFDQNGPLGEDWRWFLAATAQRFELGVRDVTLPAQDDFRYRHRVERAVRDRDRIDLQLGLAAVRREDYSSEGYNLGLYYRYRPRPHWEIVPFLRYDAIADGAESLTAPRVGLEATRFWRATAWEGLLALRAAYGELQRSDQSVLADGSDYSVSLSGSLARGDAQRLRTEIEGDLGRGEFRFTERGDAGIPGGPVGATIPLGAEDYGRLRLRLTRRRGTSRLSGWIEGAVRRITPVGLDDPVDRRTSTATLEAGRGALSFVGSAGGVRVDAGELSESSTYAVGTLGWRPFRPLELHATYRTDTREFDALPRLGAERVDAGASFQAGLLTISVTAYRTWEDVSDGRTRQNDGVIFSIQRDFAGWLPVVTGERRRGTIR